MVNHPNQLQTIIFQILSQNLAKPYLEDAASSAIPNALASAVSNMMLPVGRGSSSSTTVRAPMASTVIAKLRAAEETSIKSLETCKVPRVEILVREMGLGTGGDSRKTQSA
jgi:hypothetical protein